MTKARVAQFFLFLLLGIAAADSAVQAAIRKPYIPENDNSILQQVPSSSDPRVRHFAVLRRQLQQHPHNMQLALKLSRAYINYGRSTGDARFLGRALAVIQPWMRQRPPPVPAMLVHATILQSRHYFRASRYELRRILKRDPGNVQALLTLATVAVVQGDFSLANTSCVKLATNGGPLLGTACTAMLRSYIGHARQAYALLTLIQNPGPKAPADVKAWIQGLMADTAKRLGKPAKADAHFEAALQLTPGDNFLLADYGDFLLDHNRPQEVIALVKDYTQSDTSFLRLVFAEHALHKPRTQQDIREMAARFKAMDQRGSHVFRREQARFVLYLEHKPQRALKLAERNWSVQRAPKDVRIYLEAALAAGKPQAAKPVIALLARSHLEDPHIDPLARRVRHALQGGVHRQQAVRRP